MSEDVIRAVMARLPRQPLAGPPLSRAEVHETLHGSPESNLARPLTRDIANNPEYNPGAMDFAMSLMGGRLPLPRSAGIRAYHGSPHDFDRFDLSKIGTGEGAQAYGHGLYFAEAEPVAREYRDVLSPFAVHMGGKKLTPTAGTPEDIALAHLEDAFFRKSTDPFMSAANDVTRAIERTGMPAERAALLRQAKDKIFEWDNAGAIIKPSGHMYEVNINARPEQFLDWDRPLRDQPIADIVASRVPDYLRKPFETNVERGVSGGNVYHNYLPNQSFSIREPGSGKYITSGAKTFEEALRMVGGDNSRVRTILTPTKSGASEALAEAGIPGIRYLDQGSRNLQILSPAETTHGQWVVKQVPNGNVVYRGADEAAARAAFNPTSNYVVFDDSLIDILRKYALPGIPAAGALGAAASSDGPAFGSLAP